MSVALRTAELPEEALAFIHEGTPKSAAARVAENAAPPAVASTDPSPAESSSRETLPALKAKSQSKREMLPPQSGLVALTLRVPAEIQNALARASFERKMQRQAPWTQQEIAADALWQWLKKQGHL